MTLADRVRELEESTRHEKHLQGLLPICSYCKKIRDNQNYWQQVEHFVETRADVAFSHSILPRLLRDSSKARNQSFLGRNRR